MASSRSSPSSSFSAPKGGWTYDVFLSFRGEDTRNNFVDHLYTALAQKGIHVFKDDQMLRQGNPISPELLKAIEESRFALVVFSKNYANSSWCLDELDKILKCQDEMGQMVLPVFYHVDPSDVRGQKRDYATAFQQLEEKFSKEKDRVNRWRKTLAQAANLSGWHITPESGGESLFINKIVQQISGDIQPHGFGDNLIGIESHVDKLNSLLDIEATHQVRMVGICGMGGIGKTTIARVLFRRISHKFEGSCFVKSVRENSKRDICTLQDKILKDILETDQKSMIIDPMDGAEMISKRICNKKVLVLDDVDDDKQIEFLAASREWFGAGSRIIITTRDKRLISYMDVYYELSFLLMNQAVVLFSMYAFRKNSPPEGYEELSDRAIRYTGCLPLALVVLGSYFHGRRADVWDSALNRLAKTPHMEIFEKLKISFDGLEASEKEIFLDIACLFKGCSKTYATKVLDSFGFDPKIGISVLLEKSLITVSKGLLDMHDLVQDMGLKIVRESSPNSRLWQHEQIHDIIKKNKALEEIEAIMMPIRLYVYNIPQSAHYPHEEPRFRFHANIFENMRNTRLLQISSEFTSFEPTCLPDELRWLYWDFYPFSSLPLADMCKLVALESRLGKIERLWLGQKVMPYLKYISLFECHHLESFPDVSGAPNLEKVILAACSNLVEVHESLGSHRKLANLVILDCEKLKCLPSRIEMVSLERLSLHNCCSLENIPEVSPCMVKLSTINLDGCSNLKNIPNSIWESKYLKSLDLYNCKNLQKLPEGLGSLEKIEELWLGLYYNTTLEMQTESINFPTSTNLCCLRKLDLSGRQIKDEDFPSNLHAFSFLEELDLSGNSKLIQFPDSISHLSSLKYLGLNDCEQLQNIQGLPSGIQVLKAKNCKTLKDIEDLTQEYVWLYNIRLVGCEKLLENQENKRCLSKMLEQTFLKKCATADHLLSIAIPGSKIPSWLKKQQHGDQIALKLPPKSHTGIMGLVVCVWLQGEWDRYTEPLIRFKTENDGKLIPDSEGDCIDGSLDVENGSVWLAYLPFSFLGQQVFDDFEEKECSLFVDGGRLLITIEGPHAQVVRCGAHIVYKEDVDSIQQSRTDNQILDYGAGLILSGWMGNTFHCRERCSSMHG